MHTVLCVQLRTENDLKEIATVRNLTVMCKWRRPFLQIFHMVKVVFLMSYKMFAVTVHVSD
jgi:hypothetical protein